MEISTGVILLVVAGVVGVFWALQRRGSSSQRRAGRRYRGSNDDGAVVLWSAGSGAYSDTNDAGRCEEEAGHSDDAGSCDSGGGDSGGGDGGGGGGD